MTTPAEYREMADEMERLAAAVTDDGDHGVGSVMQGTAVALRDAAEKMEHDTRTVAEIRRAVEDVYEEYDGCYDCNGGDIGSKILARLGLEETP